MKIETNILFIAILFGAYSCSPRGDGSVQILPPVPIPLPSRDWKKPSLYGFENDLDNGLPFWPQQMISDHEMMCVYTAEELLTLDESKDMRISMGRMPGGGK